MMLVLRLPDNCHAERRWIVSVIIGEFLGLEHELGFDSGETVRITADDKALELPDTFFTAAGKKWLSRESLPKEPLQKCAVTYFGQEVDAGSLSLPLLYGSSGLELNGTSFAKLGLDIFGSAFFMLSRYEEAVSTQRDIHDRFPAVASIAYREGFLWRPLIDEYVEVLWGALQRLWPRLTRKTRQFKLLVSCDVDQPYHPSAASISRLIKTTAGELVKKRIFNGAASPVKNYFAIRKGDWHSDPYYYIVDWMMDMNEKAGNKIAFYFIPEITDAVIDGACPIGDPAVRAMMKRIAQRGHEIGIHPGYHTYRSKENTLSGKRKLQEVLDQEQIRQPIAGGRQHYLRWSTETPAIWDAAGLEYDSTLGYADQIGFRCGTCHEYPMFDLHRRTRLGLRQRPLICMDFTVAINMGYGYTASTLSLMERMKSAVRRFNGNFTLLWHNSRFAEARAKEIYCELIA